MFKICEYPGCTSRFPEGYNSDYCSMHSGVQGILPLSGVPASKSDSIPVVSHEGSASAPQSSGDAALTLRRRRKSVFVLGSREWLIHRMQKRAKSLAPDSDEEAQSPE